MREIRFRAWDDSEKCMIHHERLIHDPDDWFIGLLCSEAPEGDVLMQYTGLKDKNGTPIFEGDIVRAIAEEEHSEMTRVSDVVCNTDGSGQFQVRMNQSYSHGLPVTWGGWESLEVLGNIYEHPHLLDNHDQND